jgi:hypothetical protein
MDHRIIFIFGCAVFFVTVASGFIYLLASDDPEKRD